MAALQYTGNDLLHHVNTLIGDRWAKADTWKRVEHDHYQVVALGGVEYLAGQIVQSFRTWNECVWWADAVRSGLLLRSAQLGISPIAAGSISALHVGWHHPPDNQPGKGHRLNWAISTDGTLWFLDMSFYPRRHLYKLTDQDDGFFSLYC